MATILVVDDRAPNREFLVTLLGYHGHRMLEASDGAQALAIATEERPQVVITDILMPTMDGYEFVRRLREDRALAQTAVVFYTAHYRGPEAEKLARDCGVSFVLSKPCEPDVVLATVAQALAGRATPAAKPPNAGDFDAEHLRLLTNKLAQTANELGRTNQRLDALIEISLQLSSERDPRLLLESVCRHARELAGAKYAVLAVGNRDEGNTNFLTASGMEQRAVESLGRPVLREGVVGAAIRMRKPCRVVNAAGDPAAVGLPPEHPPVHSLLATPIVSLLHAYGWIALTDKVGAEEFSDEDERLLGILGAEVGRIYENGSLYAELQTSEAGLRRAQSLTKLAHVITGPGGSFESWSDNLPELVGVQPSAMPRSTREWLDMLHPEDRAGFREASIQAGVSGARADAAYRLRRPNGEWIHVRQVIEPLKDHSGAQAGLWFSTLQDVTDQKRAQEELRDSELRFRQIAENIRDVFFLIDAESNRTLYLSPAFEEIWGRTRESVYANTDAWTDAIHPEDRAATYESYAKGMSAGRFEYEYRIVRPDGSVRWIESRGFPVRDETGKLYRITGVAEDITKQKRAAEELRESERRFRDLLGNVQLVSLMLDSQARITYCNDYFLALTGWRREEVLRQSWFELFIPPGTEEKSVFSRLLANQPAALHHENEILTRSGGRRLIRWSNSVLKSATGEVIGTASIGEDITEQKRAEAAIRRLNRVYAVLSGINALIVRVSSREELYREACKIVVEAGKFPKAWIGILQPDARALKLVAAEGAGSEYFAELEASLKENFPRGDGPIARAIRERKAIASNDLEHDVEVRSREAAVSTGSRALVALPLVVRGECVGVLVLHAETVGFFVDEEMKLLLELAGDISFALQTIQDTEKLDYLAYYDGVTGLANAKLFHERLEQHIMAAQSSGRKLAVFIIDVERFKSVNDAFGRQAGDGLLKQIAERISGGGGDAKRFARIGADHFAVVRPEIHDEDEVARLTDKKLHECFNPPFEVAGKELRVSAKVGIAVFPADGADSDTLLRNAEAALKKAKASGDRYLFYTQQMTERVAEKLALESKLRQAVENEEFVLHYQPKVDLETRSIVGVEALIRWQSPERGLVPPLHFIPLLEETGMILKVGAWALKRAALDHRAWVEQNLKAPRVAVNVSQIQLRQRDFVRTVEQAIMGGVAPTGIDLEITESLIMEDIRANVDKLIAVRGLGVQIAIDDFGTGYSSLGYLAKLPVQALKIDRSFIIAIQDDPNATTLVSTIISLAHSLRLKVIAEGVETEEQAKFLRLMRCDEMQGYLFSKPLPLAEITALLGAAGKAD
jgi:diguanylate cyclase (GGDEF)-like protein/PAS domain S-box-containing protein